MGSQKTLYEQTPFYFDSWCSQMTYLYVSTEEFDAACAEAADDVALLSFRFPGGHPSLSEEQWRMDTHAHETNLPYWVWVTRCLSLLNIPEIDRSSLDSYLSELMSWDVLFVEAEANAQGLGRHPLGPYSTMEELKAEYRDVQICASHVAYGEKYPLTADIVNDQADVKLAERRYRARHPVFTRRDWLRELDAGNTRKRYWAWVVQEMRKEAPPFIDRSSEQSYEQALRTLSFTDLRREARAQGVLGTETHFEMIRYVLRRAYKVHPQILT